MGSIPLSISALPCPECSLLGGVVSDRLSRVGRRSHRLVMRREGKVTEMGSDGVGDKNRKCKRGRKGKRREGKEEEEEEEGAAIR